MSLSRSMPRAMRLVLLIVALVAMLGVTAVAESPNHIHAKAPAGSCDVCFTAHIAAYQQASAIFIPTAPVTHETVLAPFKTIAGYKLFTQSSSLSRGPPRGC